MALSAIYINSFKLPFKEHSEDRPNNRLILSEIPDPADTVGTFVIHANYSFF
jgi:hypothetical protein